MDKRTVLIRQGSRDGRVKDFISNLRMIMITIEYAYLYHEKLLKTRLLFNCSVGHNLHL